MNNDTFDNAKDSAREIKESLQEGAAQVSRRSRATMDRGEEQISEAMASGSDRVADVVHDAKDTTADVRTETEDFLSDLYDHAVDVIRERPVYSVLIAGVLGACVALLARRAVS